MAVSEIDELRAARERAGLAENGDPRDLGPSDDDEAAQNGRSIADRAGDDPEPEELFAFENGETVTISKLIARGTPIEYRFNLNSKGISGGDSMGLVAFSDPNRTLVVPVRAGKVVVDPTYNDDGSIKHVRITANFKPTTAYDSRSSEARAALGLE